jgi:D-alanyl-D-alanine carboxypeptidase (penicillin-binding protein 5/6)
MNQEVFKRRFAEIGLALLIFIGAFFVFSLAFGFADDLFSNTQEPDTEQLQQDALRNSILSDRGEIVEVQVQVPDPDPVPQNQREYPAQRIFNLSNLRPISLEQARRDVEVARELRRQQEELLAALNIEHSNEPDGQYILQFLERLGSVNARSFLVGDLDTGEVIFERKAHEPFAVASITKFFTAYVAAEYLQANELATIDSSELAVEGSRAGFRAGDSLTIRDLLYPLLLVSSNDAGEVIANQRDRQSFIAAMNNVASVNDLNNTSFSDPTGLSQNNISTARDLFKFMRVTKDTYPQIVGISQLSQKRVDDYTWININRATQFPEFRGGKTGFTNAARQTSIGYYEIQLSNGQTKDIGIIILQSNTRQQDTRNILDYLKESVAFLAEGEELPEGLLEE